MPTDREHPREPINDLPTKPPAEHEQELVTGGNMTIKFSPEYTRSKPTTGGDTTPPST